MMLVENLLMRWTALMSNSVTISWFVTKLFKIDLQSAASFVVISADTTAVAEALQLGEI